MQRPAKPFTPVRFRIQPPYNIMKIGIIGYGFVGKAIESGFKDEVEILKIDPNLNNKISDLKNFHPRAIFICVPTPMNEDNTQNISVLKKVLKELLELNLNTLVVIKSTVLPNYIDELGNLIPNFVYNPEFLREKHAEEDFISSNLIVFGGKPNESESLGKIYKNYTKCLCKDYIYTDAISASFIKYTINSFLATKVSFFNELKKLYESSGTQGSWDDLIYAISRDHRIGDSHMNVPGHDGRLGFGGACLPKDTNAFSLYAELQGENLNVLKSAIKTNNKIRASYNSLTKRESEQNIKYKGEN